MLQSVRGMLHERKGTSLLFVLLVMAIFSVIGVALATVTFTSMRSDTVQQTGRQAYFSARSAVQALAYYLEKNPSDISNLVGTGGWKVSDNIKSLLPGTNTKNSVTVKAAYVCSDGKPAANATGTIKIVGESSYQGQTGMAAAYLTQSGSSGTSGTNVFDNLIYLTGNLNFAPNGNGVNAVISTFPNSAYPVNIVSENQVLIGNNGSANLTFPGKLVALNGNVEIYDGSQLTCNGIVFHSGEVRVSPNGVVQDLSNGSKKQEPKTSQGLLNDDSPFVTCLSDTSKYILQQNLLNGITAPPVGSRLTTYNTAYFGTYNGKSGEETNWRISSSGYLSDITGPNNPTNILVKGTNQNQDIYLYVDQNTSRVTLENINLWIDKKTVRNVYIYILGNGTLDLKNSNIGLDIDVPDLQYISNEPVPHLLIVSQNTTSTVLADPNGSSSIHAYIYTPLGYVTLQNSSDTYQLYGAVFAKSITDNQARLFYISPYEEPGYYGSLAGGLSNNGGNASGGSPSWTLSKWAGS